MEIEDFCIRLNQIELSNAERALAILWFHDCTTPGTHIKAGMLASIIFDTLRPEGAEILKTLQS